MVRGTQRQIVVLRTSDSERFEMAYFVLRDSENSKKDTRSAIDEANRIVNEACRGEKSERKKKRGRTLRRFALFFAGAVLGGGVVFALCLLGVFFGG